MTCNSPKKGLQLPYISLTSPLFNSLHLPRISPASLYTHLPPHTPLEAQEARPSLTGAHRASEIRLLTLKALGFSWPCIAERLGMTRQAARAAWQAAQERAA